MKTELSFMFFEYYAAIFYLFFLSPYYILIETKPIGSLLKNVFHFLFNPYPTAFPYGNGMVLHFYQLQESSTTKTVHKIINKRLKAYVQ